jgi:hypothetical protein
MSQLIFPLTWAALLIIMISAQPGIGLVLRQDVSPIPDCDMWTTVRNFTTCIQVAKVCRISVQQLIETNDDSNNVDNNNVDNDIAILSKEKCKCGNTFLPDADIGKFLCCRKM